MSADPLRFVVTERFGHARAVHHERFPETRVEGMAAGHLPNRLKAAADSRPDISALHFS